jgi:hypothetical protein
VVVLSLLFLSWTQRYGSVVELKGGCPRVISEPGVSLDGRKAKQTLCDEEKSARLEIKSDYFVAAQALEFFYAGYPDRAGINIFLESVDGVRLDLKPISTGEQWTRFNVAVPRELRGRSIRVVARDVSVDRSEWIGISAIRPTGHINSSNLLFLLGIVIGVHVLLVSWLTIPLRRFSSELTAVSFFFVGLGLAGYLSFWFYFLNHRLGLLFSVIALLIGLIANIWIYRERSFATILVSNRLIFPVTSYVLLILVVGFYPFFDLGSTYVIASERWLKLPFDNWLPKYFAEQIWEGRVLKPMAGDWLSSDRPPLQTGIYLLFMPLESGGVIYQVVSSTIQALILIPVFFFVRGLRTSIVPYAMVTLGMTSFLAVHVLFVWTKLFSAAYVLLLYLLIIPANRQSLSRSQLALLMGVVTALAMLCHGGAIFGLAAVGVVYVIRYRTSALGVCLRSIPFFLFIYGPWLFYQRVLDPPGDRLLKWHLAGMIEINSLSMLDAMTVAYGKVSREAWLTGRWANLKMIMGGSFDFPQALFRSLEGIFLISLSEETRKFISRSFHETFFSLWWLSPTYVLIVCLLFGGVRRAFCRELIWLGIAALLSGFLAALLLFIPGSTLIHHLSFFTWIAIFICSITILWETSFRMSSLILCLNGIIFFMHYVFDILPRYSLESRLIYSFLVMLTFVMFVWGCKSLERFDEA